MANFVLLARCTLIGCLVGFAAPAAATGIPVFDGANVAQAIQSYVTMGQQLTQLKNQLEQAKQTFRSFNGARGMAQLLRNPALLNYIPPEWRGIYQGALSGKYSGISGSARAILDAAKVGMSRADLEKIRGAAADKAAIDKAMGMAAYAAMQDRLTQLNSLTDQIDLATDPKAIADLQARIQAEQAAIANEQTKLQLMSQLQQAEAAMIRQQQQQAYHDGLQINNQAPTPAFRVR